MTKNELIKSISLKVPCKMKEAETFLNVILEEIGETLANKEEVKITGFGTFLSKERAEREYRDLHSQEMFTVPASMTVKFKPAKKLKELVNR